MQKLVNAGSDVNRQFTTGYKSALASAASYAHLEIVSYLLSKGADKQSQEQALQAAARTGKTEKLNLLLTASPDLPRDQALLKSAAYGKNDAIELLFQDSIEHEVFDNALYRASDGEHEDTVVLLLKL